MRHYKRFRVARIVMYALLTAAGTLTLLFPSEVVRDQVGSLVSYAWGACFALSSAGALFGTLLDRWLGEYTFLPLLFTVLFFYGSAAVIGSDSDSLPRLAFGLLIIGFSAGLVARWQDVRDIKISSEGGTEATDAAEE